jgi:hypothetical protein
MYYRTSYLFFRDAAQLTSSCSGTMSPTTRDSAPTSRRSGTASSTTRTSSSTSPTARGLVSDPFDLADCSGTAPSTSPTARGLRLRPRCARGLVSGHADVSSVCYKVPPCCSDQGADLGQRIKGLDQYTSGSFSLTLLQDFYGVFQQAQGLHLR